MTPRGARTVGTFVLQVAALAVLALALLGISWLDPSSRPRLVVLVDRSLSMPRTAVDTAVADVVRAADAAGGVSVQLLEFAGAADVVTAPATEAPVDLQPSVTNIERALDAVLVAHAESGYLGAVVISDGQENAGDAARALRAARAAKLPIEWIAVGRPPREIRVVDVLVPHRAIAGQPYRAVVRVARPSGTPLRVTVTARDGNGAARSTSADVGDDDRVELELTARGTGATILDVALEEPSTGRQLDVRKDSAVVDVTASAAILYVQGSPGPLARSLLEGGWTLSVVAAARADAYADRLSGYEAVVLDDVSVFAAGVPFWNALVAAVHDRGIGLVVLGGGQSFALGGYRDSALETVLPVMSEPAVLDRPLAVVFLVDKSGSMGQGTGGVDRFRLAQRAVLETARGLSERDSLGLVVFDVEARVLVPLGPAAMGTTAVGRDWPVTPRGGTRIAPALGAAIDELDRSAAGRRLLVIVTDGFVDDAPIAALRARLARSRIETIALAVGPDADVEALRRLVGGDAGTVLRVNEAAELPRAMRESLERRRARIEQGTIAVQQRQPLPFPPSTLHHWPDVAAYAVTRSRPQASVPVQSERGDPLIAFQAAGQGRVVAVTSGLGAWTPHWMAWSEWPRFAGGLLGWAVGRPGEGTLSLTGLDLPGAVQVDVDVGARSGWESGAGLSMTVTTPASGTRVVPAEYIAPGRLRARVAADGAGPYTIAVSTPMGSQRAVHLRRNSTELETSGTNPAIADWTRAGLIDPFDPASLDKRGVATDPRRAPDRSLVALALVLFLVGIVVDRGKAWRLPSLRRPGRTTSPVRSGEPRPDIPAP
jgi:hypothetical protein